MSNGGITAEQALEAIRAGQDDYFRPYNFVSRHEYQLFMNLLQAVTGKEGNIDELTIGELHYTEDLARQALTLLKNIK